MYLLRDWFSHRLFNNAAPVAEVDSCSILVCNPDQAAHYHTLPANHHYTIALYLSITLTMQHIITLPANHHSTIALYSSITLTMQYIITLSLLIATPPLLYTRI